MYGKITGAQQKNRRNRMRSIAKLMKDWQFTGPDGVTAAVELPHT